MRVKPIYLSWSDFFCTAFTIFCTPTFIAPRASSQNACRRTVKFWRVLVGVVFPISTDGLGESAKSADPWPAVNTPLTVQAGARQALRVGKSASHLCVFGAVKGVHQLRTPRLVIITVSSSDASLI